MKRKKNISFLLPSCGHSPNGGFKVVFEYANRFATDEYCINIIYPASNFLYDKEIKGKIRGLMRYAYYMVTGKYSADKWFSFDKKVKQKLVYTLSECFVPRADIYVATAATTAVYLQKYKQTGVKKIYFIQGFEDWNWNKEDVISTYHSDLQKIVIAKWLMKIMQDNNETATLIPNGFDFNYFKKQIDFKEKNKTTIVMLYHEALWKGCADGFKALEIVKTKYPELKVNLFGVPKRPDFLPDWYHYYQRPNKETHNRIYNEAAIFVGPSHTEGFCLTPPEAMQCGCAVACTNIGGYTEVCIDEETALLSPSKDYGSLASNIIRLIEDDDLRYRIAKTAHEHIKQFAWEKSYKQFRQLIEQK
jgi:glycosyltransferase involved in cell wall biosynthesis